MDKTEMKVAASILAVFIVLPLLGSYLKPFLLEREHQAFKASHQYQEGVKEEITRLRLAIDGVDEDLLAADQELLNYAGDTPEHAKTRQSILLVKKRLKNQKRRLQTELKAVQIKGYNAQ